MNEHTSRTQLTIPEIQKLVTELCSIVKKLDNDAGNISPEDQLLLTKGVEIATKLDGAIGSIGQALPKDKDGRHRKVYPFDTQATGVGDIDPETGEVVHDPAHIDPKTKKPYGQPSQRAMTSAEFEKGQRDEIDPATGEPVVEPVKTEVKHTSTHPASYSSIR